MIKFRIKIFIVLLFTVNVFGLEFATTDLKDDWDTLQENDISIQKTYYLGFPICKAETKIPYSINNISSIIENVENYSNVFLRVTQAKSLENDVVHIVLDMPFPFAGRDYVIKYSKQKLEDEWTFRFSAITHSDAPLISNYVRLPHAAGEWKLTALNDNETVVSYTWNGELLGDFPNWALNRAWITQGNEILDWLNDALEKDHEN